MDKNLLSTLMSKIKLILFIGFISFSFLTLAQDTIRVNTFNYGSTTRDTVISFPNSGDSYQQILMLYNMRCKDNLVSDGSNRNKGCGEWDYSCNTYLVDSNKIDSLLSSTNEYVIEGFSGTTYNYSNTPVKDYYRVTKIATTVSSQANVDTNFIGTGSYASNYGMPGFVEKSGRFQHLYTAQELIAAGLTVGEIWGITLQAENDCIFTDLKVNLQSTNADSLNTQNLILAGFSNHFSGQKNFTFGKNSIQFHTPYLWDGTSNILIEFISTYSTGFTNLEIQSSAQDTIRSIAALGGNFITFNGTNYLESSSYEGVLGSQNRTCEAWVKTTGANQEICGWGKNASGQKWVFRTNTDGSLRVEVNGGGVNATTPVNDGKWHHVACVLDGSKVSDIKLYVDGKLETISATTDYDINTVADIKLRVSRGINDRYWVGGIDEVRIWDVALTEAQLKANMFKHIQNTDALFSNLQAYYTFDEPVLGADLSSNAANAYIYGNREVGNFRATTIFKDFITSNYRPNIGWITGDFAVTNDTTYSFDEVNHSANLVKKYTIEPQYNSINSDEIVLIESAEKWNADEEEIYYDELGNEYDRKSVTSDGTIDIKRINYMRRWPSALEIMSFVTPYGIGLNLGPQGKTWTFDVTDFAPVLQGDKRIFMSRGGQWQEQMDIQFLFVKGTPAREVLDINQIWPTAYYTANYTQIIENTIYYPPVNIPIASNVKHLKLRSSITGHGQEGEFIPRTHFLKVNDNLTFDRQVWKECADNPVYPQGGTWIYDRAGWCPGMATDVAEYDITEQVNGANSFKVDYGVTQASGDSRYIVSNQLVTYGDYNFNLDVAMVDVISPSNKVEYARTNPVCNGPIVVAKNNGKELVTSIKVDYWVNDKNNKRTAIWPCRLNSGEQETIYLPIDNSIWSTALPNNSQFFAEVVEVNNQADEYTANNIYKSEFDFPEMYPQHIYLFMRSNSAGNETSIKIEDEWGTEVYERNGLGSVQLYRDTLFLGLGCYKMTIEDSDDDGIDFWANNDGTGFVRIMQVGGGILKTFEGDFGKSSILNFTVNHKLGIGKTNNMGYKCFPNPTNGELKLMGYDLANAQISVTNNLGQAVQALRSRTDTEVIFDLAEQPSGLYFVSIVKNGVIWTEKVIVQ